MNTETTTVVCLYFPFLKDGDFELSDSEDGHKFAEIEISIKESGKSYYGCQGVKLHNVVHKMLKKEKYPKGFKPTRFGWFVDHIESFEGEEFFGGFNVLDFAYPSKEQLAISTFDYLQAPAFWIAKELYANQLCRNFLSPTISLSWENQYFKHLRLMFGNVYKFDFPKDKFNPLVFEDVLKDVGDICVSLQYPVLQKHQTREILIKDYL